MIKINSKSKINNAIIKKLEDKNPREENSCYEISLQSKDEDCCETTSRPKVDEIKDI